MGEHSCSLGWCHVMPRSVAWLVWLWVHWRMESVPCRVSIGAGKVCASAPLSPGLWLELGRTLGWACCPNKLLTLKIAPSCTAAWSLAQDCTKSFLYCFFSYMLFLFIHSDLFFECHSFYLTQWRKKPLLGCWRSWQEDCAIRGSYFSVLIRPQCCMFVFTNFLWISLGSQNI
jgi:hypothetical protein